MEEKAPLPYYKSAEKATQSDKSFVNRLVKHTIANYYVTKYNKKNNKLKVRRMKEVETA